MRDPEAPRKGLLLLPSWLVNVTPFYVISSSDVIWVAPYTNTPKLYAFIPMSKLHDIRVVTRMGRAVMLPIAENRVQEMLPILYRWAPWAVLGADEAMEIGFGRRRGLMARLFSSREYRANLVDVVDKRREQIFAMRAAQAGADGMGSGAR